MGVVENMYYSAAIQNKEASRPPTPMNPCACPCVNGIAVVSVHAVFLVRCLARLISIGTDRIICAESVEVPDGESAFIDASGVCVAPLLHPRGSGSILG